MTQVFKSPETLKRLSDHGAIKFDVYMFVCQTFCARVMAFCQSTPGQGSELPDKYVRCLDEILEPFFQRDDFGTCADACEFIALGLRQRAAGWKNTDAKVAALLNSIANTIQSEGSRPIWGTTHKASIGVRALDELHALGWEAGRAFFSNSRFQATKNRLDHAACRVVILDPDPKFTWPPLAYKRTYHDEVARSDYLYAILCRLTPRFRLRDYLALPYFFAHEYTAHIFAFDHCRSDRFQHGWMLHALDEFIRCNWRTIPGFNAAQAWAFSERIYRPKDYLAPISQSSCYDAIRFHLFLQGDAKLKTRFVEFVYELAAYNLDLFGVSDKPTLERWPAEFIDVVIGAFEKPRSSSALLRVLQQTSTARELWDMRHRFDF